MTSDAYQCTKGKLPIGVGGHRETNSQGSTIYRKLERLSDLLIYHHMALARLWVACDRITKEQQVPSCSTAGGPPCPGLITAVGWLSDTQM